MSLSESINIVMLFASY